MALTPDDLLAQNGGIIEPSFQFPGETEADLLSRLGKYLEAGYAYAVIGGREDDAARAWAYYQALQAQIRRMASQPSTISIANEVTRTYTSAQIEALQAMAEQYKEEFEDLLPEDTPSTVLGVWPVHYSARR